MTMSTNRAEGAVRTVVHVKPSVYVTGLMAAQRRGLRMSEFLEETLMNACASAETAPGERLPSGAWSMALFLQVARNAPDTLTGRWRVLYERVMMDGALWDEPTMTVEDYEDGARAAPWVIDERRLAKAWPRLVAAAFLD